MKMLSDTAVERLREAADAPDLSGTRYRLLGKLGEGGMAGVFYTVDTGHPAFTQFSQQAITSATQIGRISRFAKSFYSRVRQHLHREPFSSTLLPSRLRASR